MVEPVPTRFFGWHVVAAAFILAVFGWGLGFYGPPIYLHAVMERTGWPIALVSTAVTCHFLAGALVVANLPALYRRLGLPVATTLGAASIAAGTVGWAVAAAPWQLFAAATLSGIGWAHMGGAAINGIVAPWFTKTRPAALSMAYNGASIGGVIFSPLWVVLIGAVGFAAATTGVGVIMMIVIALLSWLVFARPPVGEAPDTAPAGAGAAATALPGASLWRDRRFQTLAGGMALGLFAQIGLVAHLFSLLEPTLGARNAGLAMGAATACAIAGRTVVGWLLRPGADRRLVSCACYAVQVLGSLIFIAAAGDNVALLLAGVVLFGLGIGTATSLPPLIAQVEFAKDDVQRVVSLIVAISQASYAFAPAAFGAVRALSPAHMPGGAEAATWFFVAAAAIQVAAIAAFLAGRRKA